MDKHRHPDRFMNGDKVARKRVEVREGREEGTIFKWQKMPRKAEAR